MKYQEFNHDKHDTQDEAESCYPEEKGRKLELDLRSYAGCIQQVVKDKKRKI